MSNKDMKSSNQQFSTVAGHLHLLACATGLTVAIFSLSLSLHAMVARDRAKDALNLWCLKNSSCGEIFKYTSSAKFLACADSLSDAKDILDKSSGRDLSLLHDFLSQEIVSIPRPKLLLKDNLKPASDKQLWSSK